MITIQGSIMVDFVPATDVVVDAAHFTYDPFTSMAQAAKFVLAYEIGHALGGTNNRMYDSFRDRVLMRRVVIEKNALPYYDTNPNLRNNQLVINAKGHELGDPYNEIFANAMAAYLYVPQLLSPEYGRLARKRKT